MVYSTCSFSPIENEVFIYLLLNFFIYLFIYLISLFTYLFIYFLCLFYSFIIYLFILYNLIQAVVTQLLKDSAGSLQIVDSSSLLPGLIRSPVLFFR